MFTVPRAASFALVAAAAIMVAGCATEAEVNRRPHPGTGTASPVGAVQEITVRTDDSYRYYPSTIVVHPGKVRVVLTNTGKGAPHNLSIPGFPAAFVPLVPNGATKAATFTTPAPGTYNFVCTIHRKQGQTGKLVVLPD